jgi:PST family polysaccharide transporter
MAKVVSGLKWSFVTTAVVRLASVGVSVALARLLGAKEFGVYAVALVALTAVLSLNELGVSVALVRYEGDERPVVPSVVTLSLVGSLACFAAVWFGAPYLSEAFGAPAATWPVRVMGAGVIIDGLVAAPAALLQRHFLQGRRAAADMTNFGVGAVVSVGLAVLGLGAMSLAWGRIAGSLSSGILLVKFSPYPVRLGWSRAHVRHLLSVGVPLAGASLIVFAILNVDYFIVGRTSGAVALGIYMLAFNLSGWPVTALSQPVRKVSVAAFAELLSDRDRLSSAVVKASGALMSVTLPIAATLGASAFPLVRIVYGHQWLPSAPVLVWLAALGASRVLLELLYDVLVALGSSRPLLILQVVWLGSLAIGLPLGQRFSGVVGVAFAHCLIAVVIVVPLHLVLICSRLKVGIGAFLRVWVRPIMAGALAVGASVGAQIVAGLWIPGVVGDLVSLLVAGVVCGGLTLRAANELRALTRPAAVVDSEVVPAAG